MQFGGLAFMPFALILMTEPHSGPAILGPLAAMGAFLLTGLGMHTSQTAGLALATDLATEETRPRVVALLYLMLLVGMISSALIFAFLLTDFDYIRLIQVIQGAAVVTLGLNVFAMWRQEARRPDLTTHDRSRPSFFKAWQKFIELPQAGRLLFALGIGTVAFAMQDILLEPYGAQILGLSVSGTTSAVLGAAVVFAIALRRCRLAFRRHVRMAEPASVTVTAGGGAQPAASSACIVSK